VVYKKIICCLAIYYRIHRHCKNEIILWFKLFIKILCSGWLTSVDLMHGGSRFETFHWSYSGWHFNILIWIRKSCMWASSNVNIFRNRSYILEGYMYHMYDKSKQFARNGTYLDIQPWCISCLLIRRIDVVWTIIIHPSIQHNDTAWIDKIRLTTTDPWSTGYHRCQWYAIHTPLIKQVHKVIIG
jgi:hypothetical protein